MLCQIVFIHLVIVYSGLVYSLLAMVSRIRVDCYASVVVFSNYLSVKVWYSFH